VRLTNPAIQQRVAAFTGAVDFLLLAGFQREAEGGENLEMPEDKVGWVECGCMPVSVHACLTGGSWGAGRSAGQRRWQCREVAGGSRPRGLMADAHACVSCGRTLPRPFLPRPALPCL
jgi:hypothetical protein